MSFAEDEVAPVAKVEDLAAAIVTLTEPYGYVRVIEAARRLGAAKTTADYRSARLRLYEELASVEAAQVDLSETATLMPRRVLESWCADTAFENLDELSQILGDLRDAPTSSPAYGRFNQTMRLIYHACRHYNMESAAQLSMSLVDLFSRMQTGATTTDPVLLHIARGFVETMELVFDALDQGDQPDVAAIERLLEDASNACFGEHGLTASRIEKRLGLPRSFHRVLSPESVQAASKALEDNLHFYVIRADLNADDALAEAFVTWLATNEARMITNVTVFRGEATLFDFLIASPLGNADMAERLAGITDDTEKLGIELTLTGPETDPSGGPGKATEDAVGAPSGEVLSSAFMAAMGELSADHSTANHLLDLLVDEDLLARIDAEARNRGLELGDLRPLVQEVLEDQRLRIQGAHQAISQMNGQLATMQEQATALRSRAAHTILRPLAVFAETTARNTGHSIAFHHSGGDLLLDQDLLEGLRGVLRSYIGMRLVNGSEGGHSISVALEKSEEQLVARLSDDFIAGLTPPDVIELEAAARHIGATFHHDRSDGPGAAITLEVPLPMVILEGMVVSVGHIRYVLPVDRIRRILQCDAEKIMAISADNGRRLLRLSPDEVVPIQTLPCGGGTRGGRGNVFVIVGHGDESQPAVALSVDELLGRQVVQLRPLRGILSQNSTLSGVALLGGGDVGMVVSVRNLLAA